MDSGIETAAGLFPGLERERDDLPQLGPGLQRARLVQARELRLRAEAGEDRLEPVEFLLGGGQRLSRFCCVDQELDVRAHCPEPPGLHHEVLVTVRGGRLTTRTEGAAAAASCALRAVAICDCRL